MYESRVAWFVSFCVAGIVVSIHALEPTQTLAFMHCNIHGSMDARNLRLLGFSKKHHAKQSSHRGRSAGGKTFIPSATKRIALGGLPAAPRSNVKSKPGGGGMPSSDGGLHVVLGYFPEPNVSYFFTWSIDDKLNSLSMEHSDPMHIDTANPECCIVLLLGGGCVCGTTSGKLVKWSIR